MKILKIKEQLQKLKIFCLEDIYMVDPNFRQATLYDWEKKGYVKRIRNKWYIFSDFNPYDQDFFLIANKIYSPSYVSLEMALCHYNVIPEEVLKVTSVTTRKTCFFQTDFGTYIYKSVSPYLFFGYKIVESNDYRIKFAELEKAILDYLYFNSGLKLVSDFESLRFNKNVLNECLDLELLDKYLGIFQNKALDKRLVLLKDYLSL
jgi:predicted transcriptional regulator of viral defense system